MAPGRRVWPAHDLSFRVDSAPALPPCRSASRISLP